jgi:TRAP transporter TAXI family solute receptor
MSGRCTRRVLTARIGAGLVLGGALGLVRPTPLVASDVGIEQPLRIATGNVGGVYAALGAALCRLLEPDLVRRRQQCQLVRSQGSLGNLRFVRAGVADIGVAQAELARAAYNGTGAFTVDRANPDLRILFGAMREEMHIVVDAALPVNVSAGLAGRRVDIGPPGSGTREAAMMLLAAADRTVDDFQAIAGNPGAQRIIDYCGRKVDAFAFMAASPNPVVQDAFARCPSRLVGPSPGALERVIASLPDFGVGTIPAGSYPGQDTAVTTLASTAFVVADRSLPDSVAERVTRAVFEGQAELRRLHLALSDIDETALLAPCPGVPYHPGALAYFAKAGITPAACR